MRFEAHFVGNELWAALCGAPGPWKSPRRVQNVLSCDTPMAEEGAWSFSCKTRMWWGTDRDTVDSYVVTTGIPQDCPRKPGPFRARWIVWPPEWWLGVQAQGRDRRGSCAFSGPPAGVSTGAHCKVPRAPPVVLAGQDSHSDSSNNPNE